jgi:hypothetical protein
VTFDRGDPYEPYEPLDDESRRKWWQLWRRKTTRIGRSRVPNPGSRDAGRAGCICPVTINNYGEKKPKNGWVKRSACPVHGELETRATNEA